MLAVSPKFSKFMVNPGQKLVGLCLSVIMFNLYSNREYILIRHRSNERVAISITFILPCWHVPVHCTAPGEPPVEFIHSLRRILVVIFVSFWNMSKIHVFIK